jgi:hypothetical protein
MRFVAVKSEEVQGAAMVFACASFIRQRTQVIITLGSHLAEFGQAVHRAQRTLRG